MGNLRSVSSKIINSWILYISKFLPTAQEFYREKDPTRFDPTRMIYLHTYDVLININMSKAASHSVVYLQYYEIYFFISLHHSVLNLDFIKIQAIFFSSVVIFFCLFVN